MGAPKRLLYVNRKAPYGTIYAQEALEVVLVGAAFDQDVSLAFLDDGVFQLLEGQDTTGIGVKNFSRSFKALGDFEVRKIFVESESLAERGLVPEDLMSISFEDESEDFAEKPLIRIVDRREMAKIMSEQDVVLSF